MNRWQWVGFFALCLLWSSAWIVEGAWPSSLPLAERACLHNLIIAAVVGAIGWQRIEWSSLRGRAWPRLAIGSVCLLWLPAMLVESARGGVSGVMVTELFALLPVVVVVLVPYLGGCDADTSGLLAPALIGMAGALLLLPFALPVSWRQAGLDGVVVAAVVVAAVASIRMHRLLVGFTVAEATLVCCAANAVFFAGWLLVMRQGFPEIGWNDLRLEAAIAVLFDMPQIALLLWLIREVRPERLAARYLVAPLLTVVEGWVLLGAGTTVKSVAGAVLLVFAAWRLTVGSMHNEEPGLMLR